LRCVTLAVPICNSTNVGAGDARGEKDAQPRPRHGSHAMTVLVGRESETRSVEEILDGLRERGGALVLRGEAGIGKSALLDHARAHAQALGARTLRAVGVESEAHLAFAGLHQLLRPIATQMSTLPALQREALDAALGVSEATHPDPFRVALAAFGLICDAADTGPLVVIADDAQWIDRSSLEVLTFVARRLESEPVAVLAAVRDGFATSLEDARLPTLQLGGLSESAAMELIDRTAPDLAPALRGRVLAEAAGNPLGLVELASGANHPDAWGERLSPGPLALSERLERAFAARLRGLPEATRLGLLAAALDGGASLAELVQAAARLSREPVTLAVFDGAAATGLISVMEAKVRFRHPLVRSAIQQEAPPAEVLATYGALAEVVADPERSLWHRAMATVEPDEQVADALEAHGRVARRRGAVTVAAAALERAAGLTPERRRKGERLARAAELAYELGSIDVVRSLLDQAEALELSGLEAARLDWLRQMIAGDMWFETGATKTFVTIAERMRVGGDADMALRSLVPIALRCWWTHPRAQTRQYLVDAAERVDVPEDDPRLLAVVGLAHPEARGTAVLGRIAGRRLHELTDPVAAMYVGVAAGAAGDWSTGVPFLARAAERLREQGRLGMLTQALVHYGFAATYAGEWRNAAAAGAEAARLARDTRQPQFGLTGELIAAHAAALRGTDEEIDALVAKPERTLLAMRSGPMLATAHLARATAALGDRRNEDAFAHLWPIFDAEDPSHHLFMRWWAVLDLAEAGGRGEHATRVMGVLTELEEIAERSEPPILCAGLACARPLMAPDELAESLFEAALALEETNLPFLHARTLLSYGAWLRRRRRIADSRRPLRTAGEQFDALGAARWSERARQELRATGETIARRTPEARDRLTPQELQIAQLAAEGLSNREIGERLFLSHRTIGSHLYRIFPKLEITARAQLRAALEPTP